MIMDGSCLASVGNDVKIWNCDADYSLWHVLNPHNSKQISFLAWNDEAALLASCSAEDDELALISVKNSSFAIIDRIHCGVGCQCMDFSPASYSLLCARLDGIDVWDIKRRVVQRSFKAIRQLQYSTFHKSLFGTVSDDGAVTLWNANRRNAVHNFQDAHISPATGLAFSPINEMLLVSVGLDKRLVCYDITKRQIVKVFDDQNPLTCIDIKQDGSTIIVGTTRGNVCIYDLRQARSPVSMFQAHDTSVRCVKFISVSRSKQASVSVLPSLEPSTEPQTILPSTDATVMMSPVKLSHSPVADFPAGSYVHCNGYQHPNSEFAAFSPPVEGVFSPLTKGVGDTSAFSNTGPMDSSAISLSSFLDQDSGMDGPAAVTVDRSSLPRQYKRSKDSPDRHDKSNGVPTSGDQPGSMRRSVSCVVENGVHVVTEPSVTPAGTCLRLPVVSRMTAPLPVTDNRCASGHPNTSPNGIDMDTIRSAVSNGKFTDMIHPRLTSANLGCNNVTLSVDEAIKLGLPTVSMVSGGNSASLPNSSKVLTASNESNSVLGPVHMSIDDVGKKQKDYLSSLVTDAMEGMRDEIHMDIQQLQIAMVRQFFIFEGEVRSTMSYYAEQNQRLLQKVHHLEAENRRLKKNF